MTSSAGQKHRKRLAVKKILALLGLCGFLIASGCAPGYFVHPDIDLVGSTQWTGSILFECNGPEAPTKIAGHFITIDGQKKIFVDSYSRQQVIVTTGTHTLSIVTVASDQVLSRQAGEEPPSDKIHEFGKTSEASLYMIDGGAVIVRYVPPANRDEAGQISIL